MIYISRMFSIKLALASQAQAHHLLQGHKHKPKPLKGNVSCLLTVDLYLFVYVGIKICNCCTFWNIVICFVLD